MTISEAEKHKAIGNVGTASHARYSWFVSQAVERLKIGSLQSTEAAQAYATLALAEATVLSK